MRSDLCTRQSSTDAPVIYSYNILEFIFLLYSMNIESHVDKGYQTKYNVIMHKKASAA